LYLVGTIKTSFKVHNTGLSCGGVGGVDGSWYVCICSHSESGFGEHGYGNGNVGDCQTVTRKTTQRKGNVLLLLHGHQCRDPHPLHAGNNFLNFLELAHVEWLCCHNKFPLQAFGADAVQVSRISRISKTSNPVQIEYVSTLKIDFSRMQIGYLGMEYEPTNSVQMEYGSTLRIDFSRMQIGYLGMACHSYLGIEVPDCG
jgi:hypothetical protein